MGHYMRSLGNTGVLGRAQEVSAFACCAALQRAALWL